MGFLDFKIETSFRVFRAFRAYLIFLPWTETNVLSCTFLYFSVLSQVVAEGIEVCYNLVPLEYFQLLQSLIQVGKLGNILGFLVLPSKFPFFLGFIFFKSLWVFSSPFFLSILNFSFHFLPTNRELPPGKMLRWHFMPSGAFPLQVSQN